MPDKIKRASELIAICQSKLTKTEAEVNKIINQIEKKPTNSEVFSKTSYLKSVYQPRNVVAKEISVDSR